MRPQPNQLDCVRYQAIDQEKVGLHMALAMIGPVSDQAVVPATHRKRTTFSECPKNFLEISLKRHPASPLQGAAEIALERIGELNLDAARRTTRRCC